VGWGGAGEVLVLGARVGCVCVDMDGAWGGYGRVVGVWCLWV
jgi:hypothetical protein